MHRLLLALVLLGPAMPVAGTLFTIKLDRADAVAQRYRFTSNGSSDVSMTGAHESREVLKAQLDGEVRVEALGKQGTASKATLTVSSFSKDGQKEPLLPRGSIVNAVAKGKDTVFSLPRGELTTDQKAALDLLVDLDDEETPTDDAMFGSKQQRRVGESWPLKVDQMAAVLKQAGMICDPKSFTGATRLQATFKQAGREMIEVVSESKVDGIKPAEFPEEFDVTAGTCEFKARWVVPADGRKGPRSDEVSMVVTLRLEGKAGTNTAGAAIEQKVAMALATSLEPLEP